MGVDMDSVKLQELLIRAREAGKLYQRAEDASKGSRDAYWALVGQADEAWESVWNEAGFPKLHGQRMDDD